MLNVREDVMKETRIDEIEEKVGKALAKLLQKDSTLFKEGVNERSVTHKLAEYLQHEFADWNVDCEYNRNLGESKRVRIPETGVKWDDLESRTVFPDIIVHKRGTKKNLLVIEAKKSNSTVSARFDKTKLRAFLQEPFSYKFGLFIEFDVGPGRGKPILEWFTPPIAS